MDFWSTQGKLLFTGLLGAAALDEATLDARGREVGVRHVDARAANEGVSTERDRRRPRIENPETAEAAEAAARHLGAIWNKPDQKIVASVYATAQTVCDPWLDPERRRRDRPRR